MANKSNQEAPLLVASNGYIVILIFTFFVFLSSVFFPTAILIQSVVYPNVDKAIVFGFIFACFLPVLLLKMAIQITLIELYIDEISIETIYNKKIRHKYVDIVFYFEAEEKNKGKTRWKFFFQIFDGTYYVIYSDEFEQYKYIVEKISQYGVRQEFVQAPAWSDRMTKYSVIWATFLGLSYVVWGFLAYDEYDKKAAQLVSVTSQIRNVKSNYSKTSFKGIDFELSSYSDFTFKAYQEDYEVGIEKLSKQLSKGQHVKLWLRDSDVRKKIKKTQELTFGDKYVDYDEILVFGVNNIRANVPALNDSHTSPWLRTAIVGFVIIMLLEMAISSPTEG